MKGEKSDKSRARLHMVRVLRDPFLPTADTKGIQLPQNDHGHPRCGRPVVWEKLHCVRADMAKALMGYHKVTGHWQHKGL